MNKKIACIFGHKGGIGKAVKDKFLSEGYRVIPVHREVLDLNSQDADKLIDSLLTNGCPDVVINCAGVFVNGWNQDHRETMNVNVGSNWSILRHYLNPVNQSKSVRIIMIGSSSHTSGRRLYPLYSASKAALHNLWQGVMESFENTTITVDIVHPSKTQTPMTATGEKLNPDLDYLTPEQVAEKVMMLVKENQASKCVDITFKDKK